MNFESDDIPLEGFGAPYPKSSEAEEEACIVFQYHLNKKYIRANIRTMDKVPNFDGTLDVLDEHGKSFGQFLVQMKTLPQSRSTNPGYSCEEHFIAACGGNLLPCLLIVVDIGGKKAYWRHIDEQTVNEFYAERTAKTYTIKCPIEQCIDGNDESYIQSWKKIIHERRSRILNYDNLSRKLLEAERRLSNLLNDLHPAADLDERTIFELQLFLDEYNGVLERDFKGVRDAMFFEYWKIGIVVVHINLTHLSYCLLPIPRGKNLSLIQRAGPERAFQLLSLQSEFPALSYSLEVDRSKIKNNPRLYSYELLRDTVEKTAENKYLIVEDVVLAREFIIGFIDTHSKYLGFDAGQERYSLARIKLLLEKILPVVESEFHSWREGLKEANTTIDSNRRMAFSNKERIRQAEQFLSEGKQPKIKVTLWSDEFNFDILFYYMRLLESRGEAEVFRVFNRAFKERSVGKQDWQDWERGLIVSNLKIFIDNFSRVYEGLLRRNFPGIAESLKPRELGLQVFVLQDLKEPSRKPHLEIFYLTSKEQLSANKYLYEGDDPNCPVDAKRAYLENDRDCIIEGKHCEIGLMRRMPIDFLFAEMPLYTFMKSELIAALRIFFNELRTHDSNGRVD
jgi:hypothetical protein